jgi:hypothetical protein
MRQQYWMLSNLPNAFIQGRAECGQMRSADYTASPWNFLLAAEVLSNEFWTSD